VAKTIDGYRLDEIVIRPKLTISSEEKRDSALDLLTKTKDLCLVSRTLAVSQTFEPLVKVSKAVHIG
jgi:organic hydroperoxide reductase OsmC/OhrA